MKSASWMHWAGDCSRSFPILSGEIVQGWTFSRESLLKRCLSRRRRIGSIILDRVAHATGISLSCEKFAKFNEGGHCLLSPPASWLLWALPVGS